MKQGTGHKSHEGTKREPHVDRVSVVAVSRLGASQGTHITGNGEVANRTPPLYPDRGIEAPVRGVTIHHCGSQGKHR